MQGLIISIRVFFTFAVMLGLLYPLFIMGIGKAFFPHQTDGSLLEYHGKKVGSSLIAQEFTLNKYFHSRFSDVNYRAENSGGTNLAPSNKNLYRQIERNIAQVKTINNIKPFTRLPADMVLSSASGLDPHISLGNAMLQLPRIMQNRPLSKKTIERLIYNSIDRNFIGIWGQDGVNVLILNLALDKLTESQL